MGCEKLKESFFPMICIESDEELYKIIELEDIESFNNSRGLYSFESVFEKIMNCANFGNSHGIVVGPEFSRIFAEIILQSTDVDIKNKLKDLYGLTENVDYTIKRYVDDYFLFYNDENIRKDVYKTVIDELEKYKLIITDCCHSISVGRENELCFFLSMCQR
mgnify:CR=1 FL=1